VIDKRIIYFDNAATTKLDKEVLDTMLPFFTNYYANPSAIYTFAGDIKSEIDDARDFIAASIGADSREIYFTSGGTEADNWALKEGARALKEKGKHIISCKIEHHAVLNTLSHLEKEGFLVTYLDIDKNGFVNINDLEKAIQDDTILISIMFANNEIGSIQNIKEIGKIAKKYNITFHTDAVQAYGHLPINVNELGIDMLSASAHKFNGPKGIGFLYIRTGLKIRSLIHGGSQERKRRAGTENVPAIIGMAKASELAHKHMDSNTKYISNLRDYIISSLLKDIPNSSINGSLNNRLPNNINICFENIDSELILLMLDNVGICASSGSACSSGSLDASHVLIALGLSQEKAKSSIRLSLSKDTTKEEADILIKELTNIIARLRKGF
jgi:hypothetical protein